MFMHYDIGGYSVTASANRNKNASPNKVHAKQKVVAELENTKFVRKMSLYQLILRLLNQQSYQNVLLFHWL